MPFTTFEGQRYYVPGVRSLTAVISSLAGPLPAFNIPVVMGAAHDGHGYDARAKAVEGETPLDWYKFCTSAEAVGAYFGFGSAIHRAAKFAFAHGLSGAYFTALSPMTRASIVADDGAGSPVAQFTLYPRKYGPLGGWIKLLWNPSGNSFSYTMPKRHVRLSANLGSSATRATVEGGGIAAWLTPGASVVVGSNAVAGVTRTIVDAGIELTSTGQLQQWVELSSSVGSACNTADYAVVLQYADAAITKTGLTTCQALIDYFNGSSANPANPDLVAVRHANFNGTDPAAIATATPLKEVSEWAPATAGTAPATTDSDITAWVALMNGGAWDRFIVTEDVLPRAYLFADSDVDRHATMRDYAIAERARGWPISVTTGCAWGDTAVGAGDSTDPTFRATTLNSQDVMLCAGGLDREAACISLAAAAFGRRIANKVGHNLTNDELLYSHQEVAWNEIVSGHLTALSKKGVVTYKLSIGYQNRYKLSQGLSTLQASAVIWNESDSTTWSVMQRDIADYIDRIIKTEFEETQIGADRVDPSTISARLVRRATQIEGQAVVKPDSFVIRDISRTAERNGYDVDWGVSTIDTNDYMNVRTNVILY